MTNEAETPSAAEGYRAHEAEMRAAADAVELPSLRAKYLEAAERWRHLAELAEGSSTAFRWGVAPPLL
jgi:hypothetical protein